MAKVSKTEITHSCEKMASLTLTKYTLQGFETAVLKFCLHCATLGESVMTLFAWALTHGKIIIFHLGKIFLPHTTRQPSFQDLPKILSVPKAHSFLQASLSESCSLIRTDTSFSFHSKTYWHANLNSAETVPASLQWKDSFSSMRKFREVKVKELRGYLTCT